MEYSKNNRPYPCTICDLAFKSKQFLQRHMTSHSDDRNHLCLYCEKSYKYRKGLNRHIKKTHKLGVNDSIKSLKKQFKVEDFLDLAKESKYKPQKIWDFEKGREVEVLFTCIKKSTLN